MCTDEHNVQDMCLRQPSCLASASLAEVLYVVPQRSCCKKPPNHTDGDFLTNFVILILYEDWAGRVPETTCIAWQEFLCASSEVLLQETW